MAVSRAEAYVNGVTITLTYDSGSKKWVGTGTAPNKTSYTEEGHFYPVTITAWDDAGNSTTITTTDATLGDALKLVVKETVKPVITITTPTAGAYMTNNKPQITWKVTDSGSGVNPETIGITIDNGSKITGSSITKTAITNGYSCSYTPSSALSDGSHTVKVDASDYDGNAATQASVTFKVDTVPPTLTVSSPEDNLITNESSITVSGVTNDATSSPVTLTVKLNSGSAQNVTVGSDGKFSKALTLTSGSNTITVTATDSAGKTSTVTRTVTLDTGAPVISAVTITPNPAETGGTITISVTITD